MDNIARVSSTPLIYEQLVAASNEISYPGYKKLSDEIASMRSNMERLFRLKGYLEANPHGTYSGTVTKLLEELPNG